MISQAFTEHPLATRGHHRRHRHFRDPAAGAASYALVTNIWYVAVGWLVSISLLVPVMSVLRKAWGVFRDCAAVRREAVGYLYGIGERHPILALVIVVVGTTAYFLKRHGRA